jgi:hypothetical protein
LILIALIACIIISTGSFAWGYWLAGYEEASRWLIAFGVLWLVAHWLKWKWFSALAVLVSLTLAVYGIWFELTPGWMFSGAVFALFAWDLVEFQHKLKRLPSREDKNGMKRRHLIRIVILAAVAIGVALVLGIRN